MYFFSHWWQTTLKVEAALSEESHFPPNCCEKWHAFSLKYTYNTFTVYFKCDFFFLFYIEACVQVDTELCCCGFFYLLTWPDNVALFLPKSVNIVSEWLILNNQPISNNSGTGTGGFFSLLQVLQLMSHATYL